MAHDPDAAPDTVLLFNITPTDYAPTAVKTDKKGQKKLEISFMSEANDIRILVVDDEEHICGLIKESLDPERFKVDVFSDPVKALTFLESNYVDIVLTDLMMGEHSGEQVLERTLELYPETVVILMTAHPTVKTAITALKKGAFDFLIKPFKLEFLRAAIERGLSHQGLYRDNLRLRGQVEFLSAANALGGESDIGQYLRQVLSSSKTELSASAAALFRIDPDNGRVLHMYEEVDEEEYRSTVSDRTVIEAILKRNACSPLIQAERVQQGDKTSFNILVAKSINVRGALEGIITLLIHSQSGKISPGELDVLTILTNSAGAAIANDKLYRDLQNSYMQALRALANAIEARDGYTAGHTDRVTTLAVHVARKLGWTDEEMIGLKIGCTLHDIGKIGVPDAILNKPSKLSDEEVARMKEHPYLGLKIIGDVDLLKPAVPYIISHHERYDGTGYPRGLKGEEIPIEGRLLSVVDTFDAIISDRPYRAGASMDIVAREFMVYRGTQFDPELVDLFIEMLRNGEIDLKALYGREFDLSCLEPQRLTQMVPA